MRPSPKVLRLAYTEKLGSVRSATDARAIQLEVASRFDRAHPELVAFLAETAERWGELPVRELPDVLADVQAARVLTDLAPLDRELRARADRDTPEVAQLRAVIEQMATPLVHKTLAAIGASEKAADIEAQIGAETVARNGSDDDLADLCDLMDCEPFRSRVVAIEREDDAAREHGHPVVAAYHRNIQRATTRQALEAERRDIDEDQNLDEAQRVELRAALDRQAGVVLVGLTQAREDERVLKATLSVMRALVLNLPDVEVENDAVVPRAITADNFEGVAESVARGVRAGHFEDLGARYPEAEAYRKGVGAFIRERIAQQIAAHQAENPDLSMPAHATDPVRVFELMRTKPYELGDLYGMVQQQELMGLAVARAYAKKRAAVEAEDAAQAATAASADATSPAAAPDVGATAAATPAAATPAAATPRRTRKR